jgi:hypothetical protein
MYKKIAVAFLFCLTSTIANAQTEKFYESAKPVICDDAKSMVSGLMKNWGEMPVWTAKDAEDQSRYLLLINSKKGTWTLLQYTSDIACVLGVGSESELSESQKNGI